MKNIRSIGMSVIMMTAVSNVLFAGGGFSGGGTIEGVTSFDNPAVSALKIVEHPDVIWSNHLGFNTALSVIPKGFGANSGEAVVLSAGTHLGNASLTGGIGSTGTAFVTNMLFVFSGPTGSWTIAVLFDVNNDTPFGDPTIPRNRGGVMFSSNIIAASTHALVNGDDVRTDIGSFLFFNTETQTIDTLDNVVVSLTRL